MRNFFKKQNSLANAKFCMPRKSFVKNKLRNSFLVRVFAQHAYLPTGKLLCSARQPVQCFSKTAPATNFAIIIFIIFLFTLLPFANVSAAINKQINYQGKLTTSAGVAVADGTYNMEFILYDDPTLGGAHILWTETRTTTDKVQVTSGLFSVLLGEVTALTGVDFNQTLYLGVNIGGTGTPGWDGEMTPRKKLGAVPAAVVSENAINMIGGVAGAVPYQSAASTTLFSAAGTTGQTLISGGTGSPTWFAPTAGSVLFAGTSGILQQDNANLFWDDSIDRLGIGQTVPTSKLDITTTALGVTQTTSSGLALVNTTAAAAGAQQISPALRWSGLGWKTDATAASQAVDFRSYVVPVEGTANPTGYLSFGSSVNGGAYSDGQMVITTAGNVGIGTTSPGSKLTLGSGQIEVPSGDFLAPSYSFTGDLDTGFYAVGANRFAITVGGNFVGEFESSTNILRHTLYGIDYGSVGSINSDIIRLQTPSGSMVGSHLIDNTNKRYLIQAWEAGVSYDYPIILNPLGGNVGIGTTSPTELLSLGNGAARKFWIENTATDVVGRALTVAAGGTVAGTSVSDVVGGNLILQSGLGTGTGASTISFQTGTTLTTGLTLQTMETKMTILGNGNVGIGTTGPETKLHIDDDTAVATFTGANNQGLRIGRTDTSAYTLLGFSASSYPRNLAQIGMKYTGSGTLLSFGTSNNYSTGITNEAMVIDYLGNVGIGTTSPTAVLHLKAGTATVNTAPLKFTSGTLLGTAEAGALEFLTDDFYATITTGAARKKISLLPTDASFALTAAKTFTVQNTLTLSGTDSSTLAIGAGGTLGTGAYATIANYATLATPVFTTNITTPLIIGGTAVGSNILYKSTTGAGTLTGIAHQFLVGTDGGTTALTILNNGKVGIGDTSPSEILSISGNFKIDTFTFKPLSSTELALYDSGNNQVIIFDEGTGGSSDPIWGQAMREEFILGSFYRTVATEGNTVDLEERIAGEFYTDGTFTTVIHEFEFPENFQKFSADSEIPNNTSMTARLESSDNNFSSIKSSLNIDLKDGLNNYDAWALTDAKYFRAIFSYHTSNVSISPKLISFEIQGIISEEAVVVQPSTPAEDPPPAVPLPEDTITLGNTDIIVPPSETLASQITATADDFLTQLKNIVSIAADAISGLPKIIVNGILEVKQLIADKIITDTVQVNQFEIKDKATGKIYCMWIENSEWTKEIGKCEETTNNETDSSSQNPSDKGGPGGSNDDTIPPVITLNGSSEVNLDINETYTEEGATAVDNIDGDVAIIISGSVDTLIDGIYTITYTATDTAGNTATPVIRIVNVGDSSADSEPMPELIEPEGSSEPERPTPEPNPSTDSGPSAPEPQPEAGQPSAEEANQPMAEEPTPESEPELIPEPNPSTDSGPSAPEPDSTSSPQAEPPAPEPIP